MTRRINTFPRRLAEGPWPTGDVCEPIGPTTPPCEALGRDTWATTPSDHQATPDKLGISPCVRDHARDTWARWSLRRGPRQPSGGCHLRQGPRQPNTVSKLSLPAGLRSEQKGLDRVVAHVTGRGSNMACMAGEWKDKT
jgi:hypothetical protein